MLYQLLYDFLLIFLPLLVVIDPAGTLPLYLALTDRYTVPENRIIARRATIVAGVVGVSFIIVGQAIFAFLGIKFADFQIAGGILLVVLAIIDLLSPGKPAVDEKAVLDNTTGIVPLAVPLIVGPATLTTSLLLVNTYSAAYSANPHLGPKLGPLVVMGMVSAALILNLLVQFAAMWHSEFFIRIVGKQVMAVTNKIVMIILAAIAVSLIRQGITSIITDLHPH